MIDHALAYAATGWRVLPVHGIVDGACTCAAGARCTTPGKHPAISDWVNRATTDQERIAAAWRRNPQLNIGIATGVGSGVFVLDIDPKHGGDATLAGLEAEHGALATLSATTGSGGKHFVFQHIAGLGNRGSMLPGVDIRGEGGQFVVAPSRHWSGGTYRWDGDFSAPGAVQPAPPWLRALLAPATTGGGARPVAAPAEKWRKLWCEGCASGGRNVALASMAGYLFRKKLDPLMVLDMLRMWNRDKVVPPLDNHEFEQTVNSVAAKELRRMR